jgi:hypothetical protein
MRALYLAILLLGAIVVPALADDQEKAEKQIRMMTAMSRDDTARSIVSRTFADTFKLDRQRLISERKSLGLNYGTLFLLHEVLRFSTRQVSLQLNQHRNMFDVAKDSGANWNHIAADASKMNKRIHENIYKHFLHSDADKKRDALDHYNPNVYLIAADGDSTPLEIQKAQTDYIFWRNLAGPRSDDPADRSSPLAKSYEQTREDVAITHGNTPTGPIR